MGFIENILLGVIHLFFAAMDILMIIILIRAIYHRWKLEFLRPVNQVIEPVIHYFTDNIEAWILKITGKIYSERILLMILIVAITAVRLIICDFS